MKGPENFRRERPARHPPWPVLELAVAAIMLSLAFGVYCMHEAGNLSDAEFAGALAFMAGIPFGMVMRIDERANYGYWAGGSFPPIDVYTIWPLEPYLPPATRKGPTSSSDQHTLRRREAKGAKGH
jgi:hypothetical protein